MNKIKVGVIGNGFVGGAVAYGFRDQKPFIYDINPDASEPFCATPAPFFFELVIPSNNYLIGLPLALLLLSCMALHRCFVG